MRKRERDNFLVSALEDERECADQIKSRTCDVEMRE